MDKLKALSGGIFALLGLAFLVVAVVGLSYLSDPGSVARPFFWDPSGTILTWYQAGQLMMAVGVTTSLGLSFFGGYRVTESLKPSRIEA